MEDAGIYARQSDRLGRAVQLGVASSQAISVSFPESPPADADPEHPLLDRIFRYLDGEADDFDDVEVALTVPTDHRQVLEAVLQIPYGETGTVEQVAHMAGLNPEDDADVETIHAALRENPVPLLVPDHRVEGASGATPTDVADILRDVES